MPLSKFCNEMRWMINSNGEEEETVNEMSGELSNVKGYPITHLVPFETNRYRRYTAVVPKSVVLRVYDGTPSDTPSRL